MCLAGRAPAVLLFYLLASPLTAQAPTYEQIGAQVQAGLDALERGDTAGYLAGTGRALALASHVPPVVYHHARAHALTGGRDSALTLLDRLATEGAVMALEAASDGAFTALRGDPRWARVAARIEAASQPISTSRPAFELAERDLTAEGTAWDPKTRTVFLSSLYKRKIVAIGPVGTARDFTRSGQDGIGPVVGLEVDSSRRGLWAASMVLPEAGIPLADTTFLAHGLLFHYDLDTGRLRRRYVLPPAAGTRHGFNDLTVLPDGSVYLTDSQAGAVYRAAPGDTGVVEVLPPGTYTFPNGITRSEDGRRLFVAHGAGIDRIDIGTGTRARLGAPDTLNVGGIDGLAFHRNSLIAHQPGWFNRIIRLRLDDGQERITSWETLERHHPRFAQPTTGEVAGDTYYYIANAQLRSFRDGKILPWDSLQPVLVLKLDLGHDPAPARQAMRRAIREGAAAGAAAAVAVDGRIVWSEGFGLADVARGSPVTPATRFGVGSISKTFTLAAALALAEAGQLDLDAPIERYLTEFPHAGTGVTLRRLGAHQSGISDEFASRHYYSNVQVPLDSAYRLIAAEPMVHRPGSRAEYATGLFTIVGRVLEAAAGEPYLEVMHRAVFAPSGMTSTTPNDPRRPPPSRVTFYLPREGGGFDPAPPFDPSYKLPGAGFLSTAEDVARFGAALLSGRLLSERSRQEMFAPAALADGTPTEYALGFQSLEEDGRRLLLQPGGGPGIAGWLAIYPDDRVVVAILSNVTGAPLGGAVRRAVAAPFLRPRAPAPSPRRAQAQAPAPPASP